MTSCCASLSDGPPVHPEPSQLLVLSYSPSVCPLPSRPGRQRLSLSCLSLSPVRLPALPGMDPSMCFCGCCSFLYKGSAYLLRVQSAPSLCLRDFCPSSLFLPISVTLSVLMHGLFLIQASSVRRPLYTLPFPHLLHSSAAAQDSPW